MEEGFNKGHRSERASCLGLRFICDVAVKRNRVFVTEEVSMHSFLFVVVVLASLR